MRQQHRPQTLTRPCRESFLCSPANTIISCTPNASGNLLAENPATWPWAALPPQRKGIRFAEMFATWFKMLSNSDSLWYSLKKKKKVNGHHWSNALIFLYFQHNHSYWWNQDQPSLPKTLLGIHFTRHFWATGTAKLSSSPVSWSKMFCIWINILLSDQEINYTFVNPSAD